MKDTWTITRVGAENRGGRLGGLGWWGRVGGKARKLYLNNNLFLKKNLLLEKKML